MRVLIFHGYLLSGTGSNVYNASLAQALARLGHDVHLLCQQRDAAGLPWVDAFGSWGESGLVVEPTSGASAGGGAITVYTPDVGGLLPVFVRDAYAGFEVKEFGELSDEELDRYLECNVSAVRDVVELIGRPEAALANHLVMGPVVLARAGLSYALKVHGSDLSYTILPNLERFRPYAVEGLRGAHGVLVGSDHIADRLRQAVDEPEVNAKIGLGPPGVDTELFAAIEPAAAPDRLRFAAAQVRAAASSETEADAWTRDPTKAADALEWLADSDGARVIFVGKLIVSKGVDLLLAAWPMVYARQPGSRLLIAGFGAYRGALERLWAAIGSGSFEDARKIARRGRGLEGGEDHPLRLLTAFLESMPDTYAAAARDAADSVCFAGRLEHGEVGLAVPACDALVFPSTFPEAFGMVAAEAAAAGVLPVSAAHSGALEVSRELAATLPQGVAELVSFELKEDVVAAIARRLVAWIELDPEIRSDAEAALSKTAARLWGWDGVASSVIAASGADPPRR